MERRDFLKLLATSGLASIVGTGGVIAMWAKARSEDTLEPQTIKDFEKAMDLIQNNKWLKDFDSVRVVGEAQSGAWQEIIKLKNGYELRVYRHKLVPHIKNIPEIWPPPDNSELYLNWSFDTLENVIANGAIPLFSSMQVNNFSCFVTSQYSGEELGLSNLTKYKQSALDYVDSDISYNLNAVGFSMFETIGVNSSEAYILRFSQDSGTFTIGDSTKLFIPVGENQKFQMQIEEDPYIEIHPHDWMMEMREELSHARTRIVREIEEGFYIF